MSVISNFRKGKDDITILVYTDGLLGGIGYNVNQHYKKGNDFALKSLGQVLNKSGSAQEIASFVVNHYNSSDDMLVVLFKIQRK